MYKVIPPAELSLNGTRIKGLEPQDLIKELWEGLEPMTDSVALSHRPCMPSAVIITTEWTRKLLYPRIYGRWKERTHAPYQQHINSSYVFSVSLVSLIAGIKGQ
jgi:hypothetical protein